MEKFLDTGKVIEALKSLYLIRYDGDLRQTRKGSNFTRGVNSCIQTIERMSRETTEYTNLLNQVEKEVASIRKETQLKKRSENYSYYKHIPYPCVAQVANNRLW